MASTLTVASDHSYEVFRLRQLRGELSAPKAGEAQTAYVPREYTVMDRLHADMMRRMAERKQAK
jgi:hypothetical protein